MRLGLIGNPLGHSYSAIIHKRFGGDYFLHELEREELADFLTGGEWDGLNVTIPYKRDVMPFCSELGAAARAIGSVNTLVRRPDGSIFGDNTDYTGFLALSRRVGADFAGKKVLILGSGGTSLTARAVVRDEGAREILVASRTPSGEGMIGYGDIDRHLDADILINTTPVGMFPKEDAVPVEPERFRRLECVLDVIYNPLRTELVRRASAARIPASGGLYMLVSQAEAARKIFGAENRASCEEVYSDLLRSRENIALIGMPGCGKSTVGALVAKALGRKLVDTDEMVERAAGMTVPEIFAAEGEAGFRRCECAAIAEASALRGAVIATGGGAPTFEKNRAALGRSARVYYVERDVALLSTDGRPLSTSRERLREMLAERTPSYLACSDVSVKNDHRPEDTAAEIVRDFNENSCDQRA